MNKYEMLYILSVDLADDQKDAIVAKFENIVKESGGEVEKTDKWGNKKLAYAINYKTEGYYVLMTFSCKPELIKEIDRVAGITEGMMRRMISKL